MAHALALGAQVAQVLWVGIGLQRHALDDVQAVALQATVLGRGVGHQPHGGDPEVDQDLRADAVLAVVHRQAQLQVGVDGVAAALLEAVGAQLVGQADAAPLVAAQVHDHALPRLGDAPQRAFELGAAVAAQAAERVPGEALGVDPHQHVVLARDLALDQRQVLLAVEDRLVGEGGEVAPLGGDARLGDPPHQLLAVAAVADQVGDADQLEVVLGGEGLELRQAGHAAVGVDDLALAVGAIDHQHDLARLDGLDRLRDARERAHALPLSPVASRGASSRSTYLASTSTSSWTSSPAASRPRLVTAMVCGISATVSQSGPASTTVRLTPLTVIEPLATT